MPYIPVWPPLGPRPYPSCRDAARAFAETYFDEPRQLDPAGFDSSWHFRVVGREEVYRVQSLADERGAEVFAVLIFDPEPLPEGAP